MDFQEPELSGSGFHRIQLRSSVIEGASCAIFYSAEVLRHDQNSPNETNDVIGLRACKTALNNTILLPERAPQHYISGSGYLPIRINVLFYGADSSGKVTLVRAFCAEHNYNLIVVSYAGFDAVHDIPLIMAKAEQCEPCVILFDNCLSEFRQNRDPRIIGMFKTAQSLIRDRGSKIWNVFCTVEKPFYNLADPNSLHHAFYSAMEAKVWSGDNGTTDEWNPTTNPEADLLVESDRLAAFIKAIGRYHNGDPSNNPFTQQELAELARASSFCTVGNIFNFVNKLFLEHVDRVGISELINLETNSPTLIPPFQSFMNAINANRVVESGGMITVFNAHQINIRPYSPAFEHSWE